jgi:hypothetical protein
MPGPLLVRALFVMMLVATNESVMGRFVVRSGLAMGGWAATGLMGLALVALAWSAFL